MTSGEIITVTLAGISSLTSVAVAFISNWTKNKVDIVVKQVDDNTKITNQVKETVDTVKTQTDGMNDQLVKVSGLLGEQVGNKAGRAEQKAETAADKLSAIPDAPVKVEVVNEPLQVIPPK